MVCLLNYIFISITTILPKFAVRNTTTGNIRYTNYINSSEENIIIPRDNHTFISNQVSVKIHDFFHIESISIFKRHRLVCCDVVYHGFSVLYALWYAFEVSNGSYQG